MLIKRLISVLFVLRCGPSRTKCAALSSLLSNESRDVEKGLSGRSSKVKSLVKKLHDLVT